MNYYPHLVISNETEFHLCASEIKSFIKGYTMVLPSEIPKVSDLIIFILSL